MAVKLNSAGCLATWLNHCGCNFCSTPLIFSSVQVWFKGQVKTKMKYLVLHFSSPFLSNVMLLVCRYLNGCMCRNPPVSANFPVIQGRLDRLSSALACNYLSSLIMFFTYLPCIWLWNFHQLIAPSLIITCGPIMLRLHSCLAPMSHGLSTQLFTYLLLLLALTCTFAPVVLLKISVSLQHQEALPCKRLIFFPLWFPNPFLVSLLPWSLLLQLLLFL